MKLSIDQKALNKALKDIAVAIHRKIVDSTSKGLDMNGYPFKRYSEAYLKHKAKYQRGRGSGSLVNLMLTGKMINAISHKKSGDGYDVYFTEKPMAIRASYHHFGQGQPKRSFFGVSAQEEKQIFETYMIPIGRIVK